MPEIPIVTAIAWALLALALLAGTSYLLGYTQGSSYPDLTTPTRTEQLKAQDRRRAAAQAQARQNETLPPALVTPVDNPFTELPALADVPLATGPIDLVEVLREENTTLEHTVETLTTGKKRALRHAAIGRARVAHLTDLLTRPRRPTKTALAAEVVEVGSTSLPAIPPAVLKEYTND
jgi:hypothetical protein